MLKKTVEFMTTREAVTYFLTKELKEEYKTELEKIDFADDFSIQNFLDYEACDIKRLTEEQCEILGVDYTNGYYIY